jgi:type IV secretory pathway TraG/TraD family ATPase VirD4
VIGARQGRPISALAVIDEFSAIATDQVVGLFARARGAGLSMVLGTQEFSDLRLPGRERLVDQVVGNLTSMIAHRQVVPASAEAVSRLAGTVGAWRTSQRSDGSSARQRVLEPRIDPETIRTLPPGWAVVIDLVAGGAEIARIMCASRAVWRDGRIEGGDIDA